MKTVGHQYWRGGDVPNLMRAEIIWKRRGCSHIENAPEAADFVGWKEGIT